MGIIVEKKVEENLHSQKWFKNWKVITLSTISIIALILAAISYYQATHFNANSKINSIEVSGMTADQALKRLQTSVLTNEIHIGEQQIVDGKDTKMGFTTDDLPRVKQHLKNQWSFFPSFKEKDYTLMPGQQDQYRRETLKNELEQKLTSMNQSLTAPIHAHASLVEGEIVVSKSVDGTQYDVASLMEEYEKHGYTSEIHLNPIYLLPFKEDSEKVKKEEQKLQELLQHSVEYKVQDKVHTLSGSELIKNATISEDLQVSFDPSTIKSKITEINAAQSTLGKDFSFKTHSGSIISVKGQGYGWALDMEKETAQIQAAFENGETSITASNTHGNGWSGEGYGYETTANNGIGDTYAEVSIAEQRIWIYKAGQLVLTTNVVTGKHSTGEDTSPGVWYILFKRTPYTLKGSAVGKADYSVPVSYWAPFTNSGQGFHDAGWRTNWSSTAYLAAGSGGCINVAPNVMKTVYDNLSVYQPVVVY
ncbi:L,D-transpeptidase family protein [Bacillus sp. OK048]|uniref:L,D-transpeptidase family protein n=1 Tax=Bacillus sp. OK048 TaxID=1882761 RepID=UPI00088599C3|nr:L,D-transpeptidase family protein [Bacillus sp. OK048]SDM87130.1 peptidoglycan transpeptidase precursor, ErfK-YbiS-YhnG family [Bacillus sp. OK048]